MRCLARSLVLDDNLAADISQNTWLAALQHPPTENKPLRTWLVRVVRNFARKEHRGQNRRRKHEKEAPSPQGVPSTEDVVAREEVRRQVVEAVLRLRNPYRSTILLRYFENLPPLEIAKRFNIPVDTVKTRLKRGLKQLREMLDHENDGDRKAWCLMLAPLAGLTVASPAAAAATAGLSAAGIYVKIKLCIVAALLIGTTFTLWHLLTGSLDDNRSTRSRTGGTSAGSLAEAPSRDSSGQSIDETKNLAREAYGSAGPFIAGRVSDKDTGHPITAFDLSLTKVPDQPPWGSKDQRGGKDQMSRASWIKNPDYVIHETVRDENGMFRFSLEKGGRYRLRIGSSRFEAKSLTIEVDNESGLSDLLIQLDPGTTVFGRVVENETGLPVAGALVAPSRFGWYDLTKLWHGFDEYEVHARTDEGGRFNLSGVPGSRLLIAAIHPDFAEGFVHTGTGDSREVEIRLDKGFRISGRAWSDRGETLPGLMITMKSMEIPIVRTVVTSADGSYTTPPARKGILSLIASPPPGETEESFSFITETKQIQLIDRDVRVDFGLSATSADYVNWHGCVLGVNGSPVPETRITASYATFEHKNSSRGNMDKADWGSYFNDLFSVGYKGPRMATSDSQGRFELNKLIPGRYKIELLLPGTEHKLEWGYVTFDTFGIVERDIDLEDWTFRGTVVNERTGLPITGKGGSISIRKQTPPHENLKTRIDDQGCFRFHDVDPGLYSLGATIPGFPEKEIKWITISKDMKDENLLVMMSQGGMVRLACRAFTDPSKRGFSLSFRPRDPGEAVNPPQRSWHTVKSNGTLEAECCIDPGKWIATLNFPWFGLIEREFDVYAGETTEVNISGDELVFLDTRVTLSGTVCRSDGSAFPDVHLEFIMEGAPWKDKNMGSLFDTTSDSRGCFTVGELRPGRWLIVAETAEGMKTHLPDLYISPGSPDRLSIRLAVPGGTVSGTFVDSHSGRSLHGENREWQLYLHDAKANHPTCSLSKPSAEESFTLTGVPPGCFRLEARILGYQVYFSDPFIVEESLNPDLGEIGLDPNGILDLIVTNPTGKPISCYRVTCLGSGRQPHFQGRDSSGRSCFDRLPLGPVRIVVSAQGFEDKEITTYLEPGRSLELNVVLAPK